MTAEYRATELQNAKEQRDAARAQMNNAKAGSRKWREAEENLNWWQGRVAALLPEAR